MLKNMKIGRRLLISFICVALIASISGVVSIFVTKNIDTNYSKALVYYGFSQGDIGKALCELMRVDGAVHDIVSYTNQEDIETARKEKDDALNLLKNTYLPMVEQTIITATESDIYDKVEKKIEDYLKIADEIMAFGDTLDLAKTKQAQGRLVAEVDPVFKEAYSELKGLLDENIEKGTQISDELTVQSNMSLIINIILVITAFVVSSVFGTVIAKHISNPITKCVDRILLLAKGNLQDPVPEIDAKDETKTLADATKTIVDTMNLILGDAGYLLREMAEGNFNIKSKVEDQYLGDFEKLLLAMRDINVNLSDTMDKVIQSSEQVLSASEQMASSAQDLAEGATDQAGSVEELLATVSDVTIRVEENAKEAAETSKNAKNIGEEALVSSERMETMTKAMDQISQASKKIEDIINTIEDIATQTNLLSLNASIEAARAGEAGRGFAVVAGEIGKLANQSAAAVTNTKALIETALSEVANGNTIVKETAESMHTMTVGIEHVVEAIKAVADSSESQFVTMREINQGIDQISGVIQTNSATAEESSATSEELSAQASSLKMLVDKFVLKR